MWSDRAGFLNGRAASGPRSATNGIATPLRRLTEYKNKAGEVSSVLAWDDLANMELEAGNVKEARGKDIDYVREMGCTTNIPVTKPSGTAGK